MIHYILYNNNNNNTGKHGHLGVQELQNCVTWSSHWRAVCVHLNQKPIFSTLCLNEELKRLKCFIKMQIWGEEWTLFTLHSDFLHCYYKKYWWEQLLAPYLSKCSWWQPTCGTDMRTKSLADSCGLFCLYPRSHFLRCICSFAFLHLGQTICWTLEAFFTFLTILASTAV